MAFKLKMSYYTSKANNQIKCYEFNAEKGETKGLRQQKGPVGPEGPIFPVGQKGPGEGDDWDLDSDIGFPEKGAYLGGLPAHRNARSGSH